MSYQPDICIYHGNCADGFGAAWAIRRKWPNCEFFPATHGDAPPDVAGRHVLIVDFSYKRPVLIEMAADAASIVVIDHHKTAEAELDGLPSFQGDAAGLATCFRHAYLEGDTPVVVWFDMEYSGAVMAWSFANQNHLVEAPLLLRYVQDRDLWRFELPHSREMSSFLFSHPYDFETWDRIDEVMCAHEEAPLSYVVQGEAIDRKHRKDIDELLAVTARPMVIGCVEVMCANLPCTMSSDAAGKLAEGRPFGACYYDRADGKRSFSLRSRGADGVDVSAVAALYGGGGHRNAAGFTMPRGWEGDV